MCPTDEHQTGSTRPNFMASSPRPIGGENNILARLERDGKRAGTGKTWKNARLAWSILASILMLGLIGILSSLANDNLMLQRQPVLIEATALAPAPDTASAALPVKRNDALQANAATMLKLIAPIIAPASERVMVKADSSTIVPALVLIKPAVPAPESVTPLLVTIKANASALSLRTGALARSVVHKRVAKSSKGKAAPSRSLAATAKPRTITPAPAPHVKSAPIDSDVALLSAIIIHSSRHAKERVQQEALRCGAGKKCAPSAVGLSLTASD